MHLTPNEPGGESTAPENGNPVDLRALLQLLSEKWWAILPLALLTGGLGYWYVSGQPLRYTAKTTLQVEQEGQKVMSIEEVTPQDLRAGEVLNTIVANIRNSAVLRRVVRTNQLTRDPAFLPGATNHLAEEEAIDALALMVNCELRKDTRLIDITVAHPLPQMAQKLANSVAQEFIRQNLDQRFSTTRAANELLFEEAARLKAQLEHSETRLQAYKEEKQTVALEERQNIVLEKLKDLNRSYTAAQAARLQLEADLHEIQRVSNRVDALLTLPSVLTDPAVADLRQKVIALEAHVNTLAQRYKPKYPRMIQAQRELEDLRASLEKVLLASPRTVAAAYEGAAARERNLADALHEAQQEALSLEQSAISYRVLLREVESDRALYDSVLRRLKETDLTKGLERQAIAIVEPAGLPDPPSRLPRVVIPPAAAFGGLAASLALVHLLRLLRGSVQSVDQAEACLGLPVLTAIPKAGTFLRRRARLVMNQARESSCAEAFRSLRTAAQLADAPAPKKTLLFTSAVPHEGKTFCSLNFALCLAQAGQRTLLIDLDLRRPSVGESLSIPPDTPGVSELLQGRRSLDEVVQPTAHEGLCVLPAGAPVERPAELLNRESIQRLLDDAIRQFDRVVIDSAPINAVSDTLLLLPAVDLSFLVVRAGKTLRRAILRALEVMARAHQTPFGVVLNLLPQQPGYGCYYHYGQEYGSRRHRPARAAVPELAQT